MAHGRQDDTETVGENAARAAEPGVDVREVAAAGVPARSVDEMCRAAADSDGVEPLGEQPLRTLHGAVAGERADVGAVHLMAYRDGMPAGYAQIDGTGEEASAELVVDPSHRRHRIGTALVTGVLERAPRAAIWAHGDTGAARALAEKLGLERTRELLMMRRVAAETGPAEPGTPPEGIELGTLDDAPRRWPDLDARAELLRVNNAAFSWHPEQGGWTAAQLDERLGVDWVDPAGIVLAVDVSGERPVLAGFHWTKVYPGGPSADAEGEVYVVGVDPEQQGRGLGGLLTAAGLEYLEGEPEAGRGVASVVLYVEGDNTPALRTYERLGFAVAHRDVTYAAP